jgi:F-type H+-transporting ATPase subunit b
VIERFGELGFHLPSLIVYGLNFGILFTLLYLFAYKPILKMLDQRSATIQDSVDHTERIRQEAAQAEERVKARLDESRGQGQQIVNQAEQAGERVKEEARAEARREAETILSRGRLETQRERDEALDTLRQEFADLALQAAQKVINQALDAKAHHRLIEETLAESSLKKE